MTKPILSFSLLLVLIIFVPNPNHALFDPIDILDLVILVTRLDHLPLPSNALGPETTAFDRSGAGPYTGITNGRILKWSGPSTGFVDFAVTSENWTKQLCESNDINLEPVCGRPLGIEFYYKTNMLYIADAYYNLRSVGPEGGVATLLASSAEGIPFRFLNAMEVDQDSGVYTSPTLALDFRKNTEQVILTRDMTGRLMKYDPATKQVTVLLRGLGGPAGAALSKDGSFILVSEFQNFRVLRYWLKGPKANTSEIFYISAPGFPDNVRRNVNGDFWVAVSIGDLQIATPLGILLGQNGQVLRTLSFATAYGIVPISNVQEYDGKLYIGSLSSDYIGVTRSTTG